MKVDSSKENHSERKKEETRLKIITTAVELFKKKGVERTTMEEIAATADIARGTLYNYFPEKEAIIDEHIKRSFTRNFSRRMDDFKRLKCTRSRMKFIFAELIEGIGAQKEIFEKYMIYRVQSMLSFKEDPGKQSGLHALAEITVRLGQKSGELSEDIASWLLEDLFEFAFITAVKRFYHDPDNFNAEKTIEMCVDIFMSAAKKTR